MAIAGAIFSIGSAASAATTIVQTFEKPRSSGTRASFNFERYNGPGKLTGVTFEFSGLIEAWVLGRTLDEAWVWGHMDEYAHVMGTPPDPSYGLGSVSAIMFDSRYFLTSPAFNPFRGKIPGTSFRPVYTIWSREVMTDWYFRDFSVNASYESEWDLSHFAGPGLLNFDLHILTNDGQPGPRFKVFHENLDVVLPQVNTTYSARLTYEVVPVPLPAGVWLMLAALGGVGLAARKNRAAA